MRLPFEDLTPTFGFLTLRIDFEQPVGESDCGYYRPLYREYTPLQYRESCAAHVSTLALSDKLLN